MTSETWANVPMDEIVWSKVFDPRNSGLPMTNKALAAGSLKCPKCHTSVIWTSKRVRAEACLCAVKWVVLAVAAGGIALCGPPEAIEEIRRLMAP